jgi:hypothetical protein
MASSIPGKQIFLLWVTLMHTRLAMLTIERAPQEDASLWEIILWLGRVGNNLRFPSPLLRLSILLREAVVPNYSG